MNYSCKDFLPLINNFIDNNILVEELKNLEDHLKNCPECSKDLEDLQNTKNIVNSLKNITPPEVDDSFCLDIINKIKDEQTKELFSKKAILKYAATASIIVLAALIAININVNHKTLISFNTPKTNVYNEYSKDINTMFVEQDNSHLAEAGLPTDENGLLDLNGM